MVDNFHILKDLNPIKDFTSRHLTAPSEAQLKAALSQIGSLVNKYVDYKDGMEQHVALCDVLNQVIQASSKANRELIVFIDHHSTWLTHQPSSLFKSAPDVIGVLASVRADYGDLVAASEQAHWAEVETLGETNSLREEIKGSPQLGAYLGLGNQARPDRVGMYGFTVSPKGYQIQYSDPSGLYTSDAFPWSDLAALVAYINTLYNPRTDRSTLDTTFSRSSPRCDEQGKPLWDIAFDGKSYQNCHVKFVGRPWTRMTWVAQTPGEYPTVIKDSYWASGRTFKEAELYDILQAGKATPGWVRVIASGDVQIGGHVVRTFGEAFYRTKTRIVMGTSGRPLSDCQSVRKFLMAMYDVLEAHRWAAKEWNILHRDISPANIIIDPKDIEGPQRLDEPGRPKFINEVLTGELHAPPVASLLDLDNAFKNDGSKAISQSFKKATCGANGVDDHRSRIGTPMHMARAVCQAKNLPRNKDFFPMPTLSEDARKLYHSTHLLEVDSLRHFEDAETTTHGCNYEKSTNRDKPFLHLPRHDAESVLWVMVASLLRANPRERDEIDKHQADLDDAWARLSSHCVGSKFDDRAQLIEKSLTEWEEMLHPMLSPLADLICQLSDQVIPEYSLLTPSPDPYHLHEAMQRILLNALVELQQDTILDTQILRIVGERAMSPLQESTRPSMNGQDCPRCKPSQQA